MSVRPVTRMSGTSSEGVPTRSLLGIAYPQVNVTTVGLASHELTTVTPHSSE